MNEMFGFGFVMTGAPDFFRGCDLQVFLLD